MFAAEWNRPKRHRTYVLNVTQLPTRTRGCDGGYETRPAQLRLSPPGLDGGRGAGDAGGQTSRNEPFAGKWALPGGFVDEGERLVDAAVRELEEETGLSVTELEQLYAAGDPGRDPRGWTVTVAFMARIDPRKAKAVAGDDAAKVAWHRLDKLPELAFDHAMILDRARARLLVRAV